MGFKMRSGNKTSFKEMGSKDSPLDIGKWSGWMAQKQHHIENEIQARRTPSSRLDKEAKEKNEEEITINTDKPKTTPKTETKPKPKPTPTENKEEVSDNRAQRASQGWGVEGSDTAGTPDENVTYNSEGNPELPGYTTAFNNMEINADGMRVNPRNNQVYPNTAAGLKEFETAAEADWAKQAEIANNKNLTKQNQPYSELR
jgi:outer membrane biosynthesis protein TonB